MDFGTLPNTILFKRILYLGPNARLIHLNGHMVSVDPEEVGFVPTVVLDKRYYFESVGRFPFSSAKDIRMAIRTNLSEHCPFQTERILIRKLTSTGDQTTVNCWFIHPGVEKHLERLSPVLVLPETAVPAFPDGGGQRLLSVHRDDARRLFIHIGSDGVVQSTLAPGNSNDSTQFVRSVGGAAKECRVEPYDTFEDFLRMLQTTLLGTGFGRLASLLNFRGHLDRLNVPDIKRGLWVTLALIVLYLGVSLALPWGTLRQLNRENDLLTAGLAEVLDKSERIEGYERQDRVLTGVIETYAPKTPLLNLLYSVLPEGTVINRLTVAGGVVELQGTAPQASRVLDALSGEAVTRNAKFTAPLKQSSKTDVEIFTLTFIYSPEAPR